MNRLSFILVQTAVLLAAMLTFAGCPTFQPALHPRSQDVSSGVRVALALGVPEVVVSINSPFLLYDYPDPGAQPVAKMKVPLKNSPIRPTADGIQIGKPAFPRAGLRIKPERADSLVVNGVHYAGELAILRTGPNSIDCINLVALDDYVASVVGAEMPLTWPAEALKAQAVAARTYAIYMRGQRRGRLPYDLLAGTGDQVYKGTARAQPPARRAAVTTHGEVMKYDGKPFKAYYHSTCGGRTENVESVFFTVPPTRPLTGTRCGYCTASPKYEWPAPVSLPIALVRQKLIAANHNVGPITAIRVLARGSGGHVMRLRVIHAGGARDMTGDAFRKAVGARELPSTNFQVKVNGPVATFIGRGFGHGVGMCQYGAGELGKKRTYRSILQYYYAGVAIDSLRARDLK